MNGELRHGREEKDKQDQTVTARSELLPEVDKLDRLKRFCAESWSESIKLVDDAHRKQQERSQ